MSIIVASFWMTYRNQMGEALHEVKLCTFTKNSSPKYEKAHGLDGIEKSLKSKGMTNIGLCVSPKNVSSRHVQPKKNSNY